MNRTSAAACAAALSALMVAGCSGGDDDGTETVSTRLQTALCADLDAGYTPFQIHQGARDNFDGEEFARILYLATTNECPEHADDPGVQSLLKAWNLAD